ncbi:MAG TPA: sialidase family protein [Actinomycetota bacterium]
MRRRVLPVGATLVLLLGLALPSRAATNVRVTVDNSADTYARYDGGTDATLDACSTGRRQQNEPTVAVDPSDPDVVVAGANDYCASIVNPEVWVGYYRSTNGGTDWTNSLVPGYPGDSSSAGTASPVHGSCAAAGDPTQAFDADGNLFYGFICFNRSKPINGAVYVAKYTGHGATYDRTVLVKAGTPSGLFSAGLFQDKINLTVDQTDEATAGNVYVAWSQYNGFSPNNAVLFSRSTDHGLSWSRAIKVTPKEHGTASFADLAVGPDGAVYLTYLTYPSSSRPTSDVWLLKSTDGGVSWQTPIHIASITRFDSDQFSGSTGTVDCGDGPFACASGFTFSRFFSSSAVTADDSGVHVVWAGELPSGQSKIFVRSSDDGGATWSDAATLDDVTTGHQWFPDIASADGTITVVFYDSRDDPAYAPDVPPGDTASGTNSGDVVQTWVARSTDGGGDWTESQVSTAGSNFGWETHGTRRIGFWGDYIYVSAVPGAVNVTWTDSRDLVSGSDPRETGTDDDADGFDVYQPCTYVPNDINAPSYSSPANGDPCLSQGGLDQNIYGARL